MYEPNDEGGASAYPLFGQRRRIEATLDFWNDRDDVYRVYLRGGDRLVATVGTSASVRPALSLWQPGTEIVNAVSAPVRRLAARPPGATLSYRARATGWYVMHVRVTTPVTGLYRLAISKSR